MSKTMTLQELNERRHVARLRAENLGVANRPVDPEQRLLADVQYSLANDALMRAEREYSVALASTPTDQLLALTSTPHMV